MRYFSEKERIDKEHRISKYPDYFKKLYHSLPSVHDYYDEQLKPLFGPDTLLLDAGCGKKGIMGMYKSYCKLAIGVDMSLSAIRENTCLDAFAVSDVSITPFKSSTFDVIISTWTVEHLKDLMAVFKEFYRILKPNGHLILITNSIYNPIMFLSAILPQRLRDMLKRKWYPPEIDEDTFPTYYRCNSIYKMDKILKSIGFTKNTSCYAGDPSLFLFSRMFPFFLFYERITNFSLLSRFKLHIFGHYIKEE